jgi:hypothetical protein
VLSSPVIPAACCWPRKLPTTLLLLLLPVGLLLFAAPWPAIRPALLPTLAVLPLLLPVSLLLLPLLLPITLLLLLPPLRRAILLHLLALLRLRLRLLRLLIFEHLPLLYSPRPALQRLLVCCLNLLLSLQASTDSTRR